MCSGVGQLPEKHKKQTVNEDPIKIVLKAQEQHNSAEIFFSLFLGLASDQKPSSNRDGLSSKGQKPGMKPTTRYKWQVSKSIVHGGF